GRHLAAQRRRQLDATLELERQDRRAEIQRGTPALGGGDEGVEALERGEEDEPQALAEVADDRQARAGYLELRGVDADDLRVVGDLPGRDTPQSLGRAKQARDGVGRDAPALEVARLGLLG